ncbi:MAG: hypothetical protein KJ970_05225 [Candidatus Eisenbacteria bacterium]|uniref:PPM-type phosphatase domain-containing protein n=1 Tax=Eiseniibacteriota bacterium TaxID=2212470 RepID=A0A948W664_UNCEI|nr:hypothetical protein [Candidatus Eisenbacteria bacterium]MBU1949436.1 hypothetical protein [Candidatus Eisenbacteria bacterium]MBU2690311.1 hypothetical protein [Candidatus Eisenbacteria bacterium]
MSAEKKEAPLRIEMATSEIDGGSGASWADPDRVLGVVSGSEPMEAFERYLLPDLLAMEPATPEDAPTLPASARALLSAFESTHRRLYKSNRSLPNGSQTAGHQSIQVLGAAIDGRQLHILNCGNAWAYVIRNSQAHLLELAQEEGEKDSSEEAEKGLPPALGRHGSMRLKVLTLDLEPFDQVVLLAGCSPAPDLRAVTNAFHKTRDLKRGCDGLVNLMGLNGSSGAAVAFRLVPVNTEAVSPARHEAGEEVFGELKAEVESMSMAIGQQEAFWPPKKFLAEEEREAIETKTAAEAAADKTPPPEPATNKPKREAWQPSYTRGRSWRVPIAIWAVILLLVSLIGIVTLYKPGWKEVRDRIEILLKTDEKNQQPAGEISNPPLPTAEPEADLRMKSEDSSQQDLLADLVPEPLHPAVDKIDKPAKSQAVSDPQVPAPIKQALNSSPPLGSTPMVSPPIIEPAKPQAPPGPPAGYGIVQFVPREGAVKAKVWTEGNEDRRKAPCDLQLEAGWRRIFYEDEDVVLWSHRVLVREGETASVHMEAPQSSEKAFLRLESFHREIGTGFVPEEGDSIFYDSRYLAKTPWEGEVDPGWHSVRIASREGQEAIEVFSVAAGQSRYFVPRLGLQRLPGFRHKAPGRILLQGPILLSVTIEAPEGESVRDMRLYLIPEGAEPSAVALAPIDASRGLYVAALEPGEFQVGQLVRYYFACRTLGGTPAVSEIFTLTPVNDLSDLQPQ